MTAAPSATAEPLPPGDCVAKYGDTAFIGVYGTAQAKNNQPEIAAVFAEFYSQVSRQMEGESTRQFTIDYGAPTYEIYAGPVIYLAQAKLAVDRGVGQLRDQVTQMLDECQGQAFVVAGYSLGAAIVNYWLRDWWISQPTQAFGDLEGVVLLGDPQYRRALAPGEYRGKHGNTTEFTGLAVDFNLGFEPYPPLPADQLMTSCIPRDPVCGEKYYRVGRQSTAAVKCAVIRCPHHDYVLENRTGEAAGFLFSKVFDP